ncbi:MAG: glycosyltransferase family 39 protein [Xenococcaceae cyanobacterium MO_188.B32]|nr:glycosyltransferase family 39 protein [Xenococcaceae cyanobacterium MO_188.B32]
MRIKSSGPYILLLFCLLPLLFFHNGEQSLITHDEALYATRARLMLDTGNWLHPWATPHHKTPGHYWITAISMAIFGVNETAVRLPSQLFSLASLLLLFSLGQKLLTQQAAFLATIILSCSFLWFQYSHLGGPDLPFITLGLFSFFALLQAEDYPKHKSYWQFAAGLSLSLTFLVRSFMAILPMLALSPYLIGRNHHHRHLFSKSFYGGIFLGLVPIVIWLLIVKQHFGLAAWTSLVDFVLQLGSEERHSNGITFYFWNILLNMFPWSLFSLQGAWLVWRKYKTASHRLVLLGVPAILLIVISLFSTRIPHYSLIIYPYLALLAGVALDYISQASTRLVDRHMIRTIHIVMIGLGILLLLAALVILFNLSPWGEDTSSKLYGIMAISLGLPWLIGGWDGLRSSPKIVVKSLNLNLSRWIIGLLLGCWLTLLLSTQGLIGNANPDVKLFISRPEIQKVLQTQTVYLVSLPGKMDTLLRFYTPHFVKLKLEEFTLVTVPVPSYAWVATANLAQVKQPYQVLGTLRNLSFIELQE